MSTTGDRSARRRAPEGWRDLTIPVRLDARDNSLNLVRLVLACTVLFAHSYTLSGNGFGPLVNNQHLGTWAVYMFFCLSGFLITGSRLRTRFGTYLVNRIARLYPGFLVSLVLVAFIFAPIVFLREHGTLSGFLTTGPTPLGHIYANLGLSMREYGVAGTLAEVPYPVAWNGSLWSLYYEFLCYLAVGGLLAVGVLRRHPLVLLPVFALSVWAAAEPEQTLILVGGNGEIALLLSVLPYFLGGAALYAVRDHVPLTWWVALPSLAAFAGLVAWQGAWGPHAGAPLLTLFLLWLGTVVPSPRWVQHNDISYGCYVYAFPSQQLVAAFGGAAHGTYVLASLAAVPMVCLAVASWFVIERPAMRAVRGHHPARNEGDLAPEATPVAVVTTEPAEKADADDDGPVPGMPGGQSAMVDSSS
jgi:peptidoglycan/LPS O-acetylase OafA/YrhL